MRELEEGRMVMARSESMMKEGRLMIGNGAYFHQAEGFSVSHCAKILKLGTGQQENLCTRTFRPHLFRLLLFPDLPT